MDKWWRLLHHRKRKYNTGCCFGYRIRVICGIQLWKCTVTSGSITVSWNLIKTTVLVPSEARNCVGYGLGISDSVCNIADFENGVYTQMCGIVDLGDLTYALAGSEFNSANFVSTYNAKIDRGGLCAIYTGGNTYNEYSALGNKAIHIDNNGRLYIKDNSYSTGDALKAALKGVKFVFELASAKTTPLSDFIRPLPVEQGGTLTLVNEHNLDMPSVIKYKKEVN